VERKKNETFYIFLDIDRVMANGHNPVFPSVLEKGGLSVSPTNKVFQFLVDPNSRVEAETHKKELQRRIRIVDAASRFNAKAVENFNHLKKSLEEMGEKVRVVISSMWRMRYEPSDLYDILKLAGVDVGDYITYTPGTGHDVNSAMARRNTTFDGVIRENRGRLIGKGGEITYVLSREDVDKNKFCAIDDETCTIEELLNMSKIGSRHSPIIDTTINPDNPKVRYLRDKGSKEIYLKRGHVEEFLGDFKQLELPYRQYFTGIAKHGMGYVPPEEKEIIEPDPTLRV